jgi:hemerythrin
VTNRAVTQGGFAGMWGTETERAFNGESLRAAAKAAGWQNLYETGMPEIDYQHMQLYLMIEQLAANSSVISVGSVLGELAGYVRFHFDLEERLMELHAYPKLEEHKAKHVALVSRVGDFASRMENGENVSAELRGVLRTWLFGHISGDDQTFARHVSQGRLHADPKRLADWRHEVAVQESDRAKHEISKGGGLLGKIRSLFGRK